MCVERPECVSALAILRSGVNNGSMAKRPRKRKRPDLAKFGFDVMQRVIAATGDTPDKPARNLEGKDPAAVALGRKGGLKGGKARAKKLGKRKLSEAARRAARARWGKDSR